MRGGMEREMFAITPRLLLRPGWTEDAGELAAAIGDERILRMLAKAPWPYRIEDAEAFLSAPRDPRYPNFAITHRIEQPGRIIGGVGFHETGGLPEIGYWLVSDRWGEGLAVEAAAAALAAARASLGYRHFVSGHFIDNPRSGRVLEKLGFRRTGTAPRFSKARGCEIECVLFERDEDTETQSLMAA